MASSINASTTAGVVTTADTSGVLNIQTAGTTAIAISAGQVATFAQSPVLPAASIPQAALAAGVAGNGPAFSAYRSGTQSISSSTYTKVQLNAEEFDTANAFDSTTNYRFTPQVAGYYQINGAINAGGSTPPSAQSAIAIYKNGSPYKYGVYVVATGANVLVSSLVYLNGSTDYLELYGYLVSAGAGFQGNSSDTYFNGSMVRSA